MEHPEPMPDDVFDRLTILERAQFLYASAQRRHSEALDRQQRDLDRHTDHLRRLDALVDEQVQLLAQVMDLQARLDARQDDHAARMTRLEEISAKVQLTLEAVLAMLRHRNGH